MNMSKVSKLEEMRKESKADFVTLYSKPSNIHERSGSGGVSKSDPKHLSINNKSIEDSKNLKS